MIEYQKILLKNPKNGPHMQLLKMGSISIQVASVYEGGFPPETVWCRAMAPVFILMKSCMKRPRNFPVTLLS